VSVSSSTFFQAAWYIFKVLDLPIAMQWIQIIPKNRDSNCPVRVYILPALETMGIILATSLANAMLFLLF